MLNMTQVQEKANPKNLRILWCNFLGSFFCFFLAKNFKTRPEVFQTNIVSNFFLRSPKGNKAGDLSSFLCFIMALSFFFAAKLLGGENTKKTTENCLHLKGVVDKTAT